MTPDALSLALLVETRLSDALEDPVKAVIQFPESLQRVPAVLVMPMAETPAPSVAPAVLAVQKVTCRIGVVSVAPAWNDRAGAIAIEHVRDLRTQVQDKLAGWTPRGWRSPMQFHAGQLRLFGDGRVWWIDEFSASGWLEAPPPQEAS